MSTEKILSMLNGKCFCVSEFDFFYDTCENYAVLHINILFNDVKLKLRFKNVSRINIFNWSYPFQVCCLDITKNSDWDASSKYFVRDFEEEAFSFYCEKIELGSINNSTDGER